MTPLGRHRVDASYTSPPWEVTAEALAAYRDATLDAARREAEVAPLAYTIVPTWPVVTSMLQDRELGIDQTRCVQGEERIQLLERLRAGDRLESVGRIARIEERGPHEVLTLHTTTVNQHGRVAALQDIVCVIRGEVPPASRERPRPTAPAGAAQRVHLPPDLPLRYAAASGDGSAIHTDDAFAVAAGFPSTVVQGMCVLAIALRAIDDPGSPGRCSLAVRFARPVFPDDDVLLTRATRGRSTHFGVTDLEGNAVLHGSITHA